MGPVLAIAVGSNGVVIPNAVVRLHRLSGSIARALNNAAAAALIATAADGKETVDDARAKKVAAELKRD